MVVSLLLVPLLAAAPVDLTADEFKMYRHYQLAMKDPRVEKMKPERRLSAIAKDAGYKLKDLEKAIARAEAAGDVKAACEAGAKEAIEGGELQGRVGKVDVDTSDPHAVAYVQWLNEAPAQLEEEAAWVAAQTAQACPIVSTIQVWAQDKANPSARLFQALISREAAKRIAPEKAKEFADTRYLRLFEKVKSVNAGDDLSQATATPGASQ